MKAPKAKSSRWGRPVTSLDRLVVRPNEVREDDLLATDTFFGARVTGVEVIPQPEGGFRFHYKLERGRGLVLSMNYPQVVVFRPTFEETD